MGRREQDGGTDTSHSSLPGYHRHINGKTPSEGKACSAGQPPATPLQPNMALVNPGRPNLLPEAAARLLGGCSLATWDPQVQSPLPTVPALHTQEHGFLSTGLPRPPARPLHRVR